MKKENEIDPKEIYNFRLINFFPEKIFQAFSDPKHLQNWWGPKGFKNTFHEYTFVKDGVWDFTMHGPVGKDYKNQSIFREINKPNKIAIEHISAPRFILTITLEEEGDKTRVCWSNLFESVELRNNIAKFAVEANEQNLDRLENEILLIK